MTLKKALRLCLTGFVVILVAGLLIPEKLTIPVKGGTSADWNHQTFWHEPWGSSGVHKGIDIFGKKGTPAVSASYGIVVFSGELGKGGNAVAVLGQNGAYITSLTYKIAQLRSAI